MSATITAADARTLWTCIPKDCKSNLSRLRASGHWDTARPVIIRAVSAHFCNAGKFCLIDLAAAMEVEAGRYLERLNQ